MVQTPTLFKDVQHQQDSVLSLAADSNYIYSGSQGEVIYVWDRQNMANEPTKLRGHKASILALEVSEEKSWLFSSSNDNTIRIWCTASLQPKYVIHPFGESDAGDIYSLAFYHTPASSSTECSVLFFGCQNTSLQWIDLSDSGLACLPLSSTSSDDAQCQGEDDHEHEGAAEKKRDKFFPSTAPSAPHTGSRLLRVPQTNILKYAHYGYIYGMALVPRAAPAAGSNDGHQGVEVGLVTGSGNEDVKLWSFSPSQSKFELKGTFTLTPPSGVTATGGAALSVVVGNGKIYAGFQDGFVCVWNLDTKAFEKSFLAKENTAVLALSLMDTDLYACLSDGEVRRWSDTFNRAGLSWNAHNGAVISSRIISPHRDRSDTWNLITGGGDSHIKVWDIEKPLRE